MQISADEWREMKTEYVTTSKSYAKIAAEHDIRYETVRQQGKKEGWPELREKHRAKTAEKVIEKIERQKVEQVEELRSTASAILAKANELIGSETISPQSLKSLSGVLRDVKEILDIKSDADLREQEARIAKLEKDAESDANKPVPTIVIQGLPEEYRA